MTDMLPRWRRIVAHPEFRAGAREISGVAPGLAAWGLMTGVAMVQSGMSTVEALAMTLLVFAGSSQLAAIPLIAASAPVWVILATSFCVNLRFVVFSAHLRSYVMHLPRPLRLLVGYVTADMTYVLFVRRYAHPPTTAAEREAQLAYLAGGGGLNWASWQAASSVQHLRPGFLPDDRLEVTHHHRIGVHADHGADDVEGVPHVGDPVADRLVRGVLEGLRS